VFNIADQQDNKEESCTSNSLLAFGQYITSTI